MSYFGVPVRNGLPIGLGSVAGFGVQQFSPADLFSAGEQGAWYDPSDLTTLFTDSAGTTPVTGVEQFVGRMNDKSGRGNHATSTGTKRPKLAARYNLLTYTEQFDNGAWTKGNLTVSANAAVAPDGTTTADKLNENTANAEHYAFQSITAAATQYTASIYLKAAERTWASVQLTTGPIASTWFNLAADGSGGVGTVASGVTATSQYVGNGWYRCSITRTTTAATWYLVINPALGDGVSVVYAGTLNSGILAWGADARPASQATGLIGPTYQRVVDAATYDTAGFLPYLQFDGIDDVMSAGDVIDLGTSDLTGFAGAQQTGNDGCIYAKSVATSAAGRYALFKETSALIAFYSNTADRNASVSDSNISNRVLSQLLFRSAGTNTLRQNGTQIAAATPFTPENTNYNTTYRFLVGAYNNSTDTGEILYLNGRLYSVIVVLAQLSASQISATESWVAGKTGVSL